MSMEKSSEVLVMCGLQRIFTSIIPTPFNTWLEGSLWTVAYGSFRLCGGVQNVVGDNYSVF
jgi:hypothetical protein